MPATLGIISLVLGLSVTVEPERAYATAAPNESVRLSVRISPDATRSNEAPPRLVSLTTDVGTISAPVSVTPGLFEATLKPPDSGLPSVALIAAVVQHRDAWTVGWLPFPIHGTAPLNVRATPFARFEAFAGNVAAGPVTADASGRILTALTVPPGAVTAELRVGRQNRRTVPLAVAKAPRLRVISLQGPETSWSDPTPARLEIFAVSANGAPLDIPVQLTTSTGEISQPERISEGRYAARYRAPQKYPGSQAEVKAALTKGAGAATLDLTLRPGPARSGELVTQQPMLEPGAAGVASLHLKDEQGNPITAARFEVEADGLQILGWKEPTAGHYEIRYAASAEDRVGPAMLSVRVPSSGLEVAAEQRVAGKTGFGLMLGAAGSVMAAPSVVAGGATVQAGVRLKQLPIDVSLEGSLLRFGDVTAPAGSGNPNASALSRASAFGGALALRYGHPFGRRLMGHAVAAAGVQRTMTDVTVRLAGDPDQRTQLTQWGAAGRVGVGLAYGLDQGQVSVELAAQYAPWSGTTGVSNQAGARLALGYLFDL
jgi:hypothetical protein